MREPLTDEMVRRATRTAQDVIMGEETLPEDMCMRMFMDVLKSGDGTSAQRVTIQDAVDELKERKAFGF